ncbi:hypothetical protein [Legionella brunensis]|uniref:Uncharacterized protein n=1 Tax=Legionella brunensis TaxID=29422 RepID=A0A0W0STU8_9GAMM|nr:hypothetical protein [Legionella brunensis]KTC86782.1 hypothetical protein Lbru_0723 [Legionella brunensis]
MGLLLVIYGVGLLISLWQNLVTLWGIKKIKRNLSIDMFKIQPNLTRDFVFKIFFWPYFFAKKNPLERFSETFFMHYGDQGTRYLGTKGLKNFINDIFKGKNRYKNYTVCHFLWEIDPFSPLYRRYRKYINKPNLMGFAEIILAYSKGNYLLHIGLVSQPLKSKILISRFVLDNCEQLSQEEVKVRLAEINSSKFQEMQSDWI